MTGACYGKKKIKVNAYVHEKGKSLARITHLDIEGDISKIIKEGEITFVKGKKDGVFIASKERDD